MNRILFFVILFTFHLTCATISAQTTSIQTLTPSTVLVQPTSPASIYPKEVKVNWDKKVFESPLPVDEDFILTVYTLKAGNGYDTLPSPNDLVLVRFVNRGTFYYYEQPIAHISTSLGATSKQNKHLQTSTTKNGVTEVSEVVEKEFTPPYSKSVQFKVSALRANFHYCLLKRSDYEDGKTSGLQKKIEAGTIQNTWLSYQDVSQRNVTVIIGAAYMNAETELIRPYLGFRLNLLPVSRNLQAKYYDDMHFESWKQSLLSRLSIDIGITLSSIEDQTSKQYNLFGTSNLLTGIGYKLGNSFFVSAGKMWYNKLDDSDSLRAKLRIKGSWYFSASFDWDIGKSFDAVKKGLGASL